MTKKLILERLQATISNIKQLQPEQFDYSSYVSEGNIEAKCGTVCCVMGWYPMWFPEAGIKWEKGILFSGKPYIYLNHDINIYNYHGLSNDIVDALFYGDKFTFIDKTHKEITLHDVSDEMETITLQEVVERFETIYKAIKNNQLTDYKLNQED